MNHKPNSSCNNDKNGVSNFSIRRVKNAEKPVSYIQNGPKMEPLIVRLMS